MIDIKPNIVELYFKNITNNSTNVNFSNIFTSILNTNINSLIIADIENIFPDVPQENIEELINVFHNQPLII